LLFAYLSDIDKEQWAVKIPLDRAAVEVLKMREAIAGIYVFAYKGILTDKA
jgi:hypothetical protein